MKGYDAAELNGGPGASRPARNFLGMEEPVLNRRLFLPYTGLDVLRGKRIQKVSKKVSRGLRLKTEESDSTT